MTDLSAKVPIENLIDFDNDSDGELSEELLSVDDMNALPDDEDAIDRLLMGDAFDVAEESGQAVGIKDKLVEDITLPEFDEFAGFDDEFDDFEQTKPVQYDAKTEISNDIGPSAWFESESGEASWRHICRMIILLKLMIWMKLPLTLPNKHYRTQHL